MESHTSSAQPQGSNYLARDNPQSLLFTGNDNARLLDEAVIMAGDSLANIIEPRNSKFAIDYERGSIKVGAIRDLLRQTAGKSQSRRVFIIHPANKMTVSAQNAFLKILEEPSEGTYFVLTAESTTQLLPTITSRVQIRHITDLSRQDSKSLLADDGVNDQRLVQQIIFLSDGKREMLKKFAHDRELFAAKSQIARDAKALLQNNTYERVVAIQSYSSDRAKALEILTYMKIMLKQKITSTTDKETITQLSKIADAHSAISKNGNVRIQLLAIVV